MIALELPCEFCGTKTDGGVNGVAYCPTHMRDGMIRQARLMAWQVDACSVCVEHAGEWAAATYDAAQGGPGIRPELYAWTPPRHGH